MVESDEPKGDAASGDKAEGGKTKAPRRRRRGGRGRKTGSETQSAAPEIGTPEEAVEAERIAEEALAQEASATVDVPDDRPPVDLEAFARPGPKRYGPAKLEDDDALAQAYADEIATGGAATAPVEGEHVDEKTADEDRPMTEAYQPDASRGRERRRGRGRDKGRDRGKDRGKDAGKPREPQPQAAQPQHPQRQHRDRDRDKPREVQPQHQQHRERDRERDRDRDRREAPPPPRPVPRAALEATTPILSAAFQVLVGLADPRPVHARQLAAMAVKRKLLQGDPEDLWRPMRLALVAAARAESGLRPRVRFHGGSLFTLAAARLDDELARIEQAAADRLAELDAATVVALGVRLRGLTPIGLESACRLYLDRVGWRDLARIKRNDETDTWYLAGISPDGVRALVAVRAGATPIGRRGPGELRAGVVAKELGAGLLLAPAPLDEDGLKELAEPGPPVHSVVGDALARAFADASVGVHRSWAPVSYLDVDFFGDLVEA